MEKNIQQQSDDIIRVVLYGPESTGKTVLAQKLADHYNTIWIPEFARHYLDVKKAIYDPFGRSSDEISQPQDIPQIVIGQVATEDSMIEQANKVLICDTNPLMTYVYNKHYFHRSEEWIAEVALKRQYDIYLLTNIDVPWIPDPPFRDRPYRREEMFELFHQELIQRKIRFEHITGNYEERFSKAVTIIDNIIKQLHDNSVKK